MEHTPSPLPGSNSDSARTTESAAYREIPPPPMLAGLVECFWTIRSTAPIARPKLNRVLPDGCMDVIFDLGDPHLPTGGSPRRPRSYAVGAMQRPVRVWMTGRVDLLGVRFRPGGAAALLSLPARELVDEVLPLADLWRGEAEALESRLFAAAAPERISLLQSAIERRLSSGSPAHPAVVRASQLIARARGRLPVAELERSLGVSRRHLERLFSLQVGLSPKTLSRVVRFRETVRRLRRDPSPDWSRLALECGFYDQAHLIRDVRSLSGLPPAALHAEHGHVASVQYGDGTNR